MTENPSAIADEDTFTVRRSIHIAATTAKVWLAVTDPAHLSRWFAPTSIDENGAGSIDFPDYGAVPLRVVSSEPERRVTYRWNNDDALGRVPEHYDATTATEFTFTLTPDGAGTQLTVVETGFEVTSNPAVNLRAHTHGWTDELDKLVALLEADA